MGAAGTSGAPAPRRAPKPPGAAAPPVLLDTNALLLPFREGFPLERELARVAPGRAVRVPDSARIELERLVARGVPGSPAALAWALRCGRIAAPGRGDRAVEAAARRLGAWVVTADRALARRLRARGLTVLRPSGHGRLRLEPGTTAAGAPARANPPGTRTVGNR